MCICSTERPVHAKVSLTTPLPPQFTNLVSLCRHELVGAGVAAAGRAPYVLDTEYSGETFVDGWDFFTDG